MTSVKSEEYCKFPHTCYKPGCERKHPVPYRTRSWIADLMKYGEYPKEEKDEERKCRCNFGVLCNNPDCGYRHPLSDEGRKMLQKDLKEKAEKSDKSEKTKKSEKSEKSEKTDKEKEAKVDAPKSFNYDKVRNAFHDLGERYGISADDPSYEVIRAFIESMQEV